MLSYLGNFIDENRLDKGIYVTNLPTLHPLDTTIENTCYRLKIMKDFNGNQFISEDYIDNLKQCEYIIVELIQK